MKTFEKLILKRSKLRKQKSIAIHKGDTLNALMLSNIIVEINKQIRQSKEANQAKGEFLKMARIIGSSKNEPGAAID